ncbi:DUF1572 family protein [Gimesia maris]|uniref:DinB superfamily protein n=1 Tax=Gimesia maris TaxID=122 RepID=A0ABX5YH37_9PLAN|nr:DUF1572 family protein [Gimesia maris]EDL61740.1 hypothetical protein PM8797T_05545 [Gimesia maris DSM 8797]QEG14872.1 DinB superfamily protein [Gimesia maris]QGQ31744.1 DUF1572 domain-containing protein [Gimesia maris]
MDHFTPFLSAMLNVFESHKQMTERAIAQVSDEGLRTALHEHTNSIAVIMKHVAGNLISRWTDFLTTDGEKRDRNRDDEFVDTFATREELLAYWERGWTILFDSLKGLTPEDLEKTIYIRGDAHTVPLAIQRSLGHTCYHVGQIVQVARIQAGDEWTTLTIPRGQSEQFNKERWGEGTPGK